AILKEGKLLAAVEEERFNRKKHAKPALVDNPDELPSNAIEYCLKVAGISLSKVDHIAYAFDPERRKRYWADQYFTTDSWGTPKGEKIFLEKLLSIPEKMERVYSCLLKNKFHWVEHHLAHASGTFFISPFDKAIVIVIDGIGENATSWTGYGEENKLTKIKEIALPHSLGFMWEKLSEYLGFTEYDAGKVMGLSSYGDWKVYWKQFHKIISFDEDDIFRVNNDILRFRTNDFSKIEGLFGVKKRKEGSEITGQHQHIAAALQKISQKVILRILKYAYDHYPCDKVCLSGGVILNCVANEETFLKLPISDVYIPPAAHDGGNAIGAAYYLWNQEFGEKRSFVFGNPYTGPEYNDKYVENALREAGVKFEKLNDIEKYAAQLIADGNIVAWFQGRLELGPRALGNRSILADPRRADICEKINVKVKKREYFRPFAPSVLEEKALEWFYLRKELLPDRFMLFAVTPVYPEKIPAVTHVDETCRIQTVSKETNPKYYKLIEEFGNITGIPIVLNTSFNIQEPIVCSPDDAVKTFKKSKIDYLIINDYVVQNR
ncbi:carbamoyl transferase, partial [Patescibacteria group bacterium AH-259-L07]|nr:carbamoyl transferase [Patescibacteria group bacterium AH-259-L07]